MKRTSLEMSALMESIKSPIKALMRVTVLATVLVFSSSPAPAAGVPQPTKKSIRQRVELVRETFRQKVANDQIPIGGLSFSERALAQWGNWGNWGNWNNWVNWNNWNNWRNWANWANWGNI